MTKSQHTPTPWIWWDGELMDSDKIADIHVTARVKCTSEDAAFIVRAVNAHDALIEALDKANQRIEQLCSTVNTLSVCAGGTPRKVTLGDWVDDIRHTLKLAKEG